MPRRLRLDDGGIVYRVLNRRVERKAIFGHEADYAAFERVLDEPRRRHPMRVLAYCLMPNRWHLVLWPRHDGASGSDAPHRQRGFGLRDQPRERQG